MTELYVAYPYTNPDDLMFDHDLDRFVGKLHHSSGCGFGQRDCQWTVEREEADKIIAAIKESYPYVKTYDMSKDRLRIVFDETPYQRTARELDIKFTEALKSADVPKTKETVKRMSKYLLEALEAGKILEPADVVESVKADYENERQEEQVKKVKEQEWQWFREIIGAWCERKIDSGLYEASIFNIDEELVKEIVEHIKAGSK